ncbi:MAG TPA: hemin uptake protein HemP [Candidatus Binatia bacterium]|nr:hemin uptake protein HemP [Candidatus Binatia bacterium]
MHRGSIDGVDGQKTQDGKLASLSRRAEIVIIHQTKEYSLRITRNGKLILTK